MRRLISLAFLVAFAAPALAEDCTAKWELFDSKPYAQIAFPDTNVTYWRYRFEVPAGRPVALRVSGQYPHARYVNFNVYDANTADSSASLPDVKIVPDAGSLNPFLPGVARDAEPRAYTVRVVPAASSHSAGDNRILLPKPARFAAQDLELWYRVYVPDTGVDMNGGVPLPKVEAYYDDDAAETPAPCPAVKQVPPPSIIDLAGNLPPGNPDGQVVTYRPASNGLYANLDNLYLATRFGFFSKKVDVLRWRAPSFPNTAAGLTAFDGTEQVRYWSVCLGGADQRTSSCLADAQFHPAADGTVTLVLGPESVRAKAEAAGAAFLPWGRQILLQVLIYRNLLTTPGFAGDQSQVPQLPRWGTKDPAPYAAAGHIGDWAPGGVECEVDAFQAGTCGGL